MIKLIMQKALMGLSFFRITNIHKKGRNFNLGLGIKVKKREVMIYLYYIIVVIFFWWVYVDKFSMLLKR